MFETFDFLNGYLKITALVGALDVLLILHFLLSYYFCCYKKGYLIDLWHGSLLFVYFFTILVFYPFMGSERLLDLRFFYNWSYSIRFIDWAWFINVLGFIAVFFGGFCFTILKRKNTFNGIILWSVKKCDYAINRILQHENQFLLMYQINNCICAYLLFYGITTSGLFVNLRVFFMTAGIYSALSNVFIQVGQPIFLFFSLIALYVSNSRLKIIVQIIFSIIILNIYSSRSTLVYPFVSFLFGYIIVNKNKTVFKKILISFLVLTVVFFAVEQYRTDSDTSYMSSYSLTDRILFGNNIADIRDFSVILECWDGNYMLGRNIIAGIISFIPKVYSQFRRSWNTASYTNNLVGLPDSHPGLRGGLFSEPFLSGGYLGVVFTGLIFGYILAALDYKSKHNDCLSEKYYLVLVMSLLFMKDIFIYILFQSSLLWLAYLRILFLLLCVAVFSVKLRLNR